MQGNGETKIGNERERMRRVDRKRRQQRRGYGNQLAQGRDQSDLRRGPRQPGIQVNVEEGACHRLACNLQCNKERKEGNQHIRRLCRTAGMPAGLDDARGLFTHIHR